jgi:hypothetical protein
MPDKHKRTDKAEPKVLRERAIRCLRLALGADDLKLSKILTSLAQEYEARADQSEAKQVAPRWSRASREPTDLSALDQSRATNEKNRLPSCPPKHLADEETMLGLSAMVPDFRSRHSAARSIENRITMFD